MPTVGGEVVLLAVVRGNPLVNAMCVGVARSDELLRRGPTGPATCSMLVGADTGRDGIHGATFASRRSSTSAPRSAAGRAGRQPVPREAADGSLPRAGVRARATGSSACRTSAPPGSRAPRVECAAEAAPASTSTSRRCRGAKTGMTPYEVMLSESQERMLVIVQAGARGRRRARSSSAGSCTARRHRRGHRRRPRAHPRRRRRGRATCRPTCFTEAAEYRREGVPARRAVDDCRQLRPRALPDLEPTDARRRRPAAAARLAGHRLEALDLPPVRPPGAARTPSIGPGGDAAVLRIKGTRRAHRASRPTATRATLPRPVRRRRDRGRRGGAQRRLHRRAAARDDGLPELRQPGEARRLLPAGGGDPRHGGRLRARSTCRSSPATSASTTRRTATPIYPTPVVGVVGLLDDADAVVPSQFEATGDHVFAVGAEPLVHDLAGSEYLHRTTGDVAGRPRIDLDVAARLQRFLLAAARGRLLRSAHDVSTGGLAVALAECCFAGVGLAGAPFDAPRLDVALFGETQSRVVVSCDPADASAVQALAREHDVACISIGTTGATVSASAPSIERFTRSPSPMTKAYRKRSKA